MCHVSCSIYMNIMRQRLALHAMLRNVVCDVRCCCGANFVAYDNGSNATLQYIDLLNSVPRNIHMFFYSNVLGYDKFINGYLLR